MRVYKKADWFSINAILKWLFLLQRERVSLNLKSALLVSVMGAIDFKYNNTFLAKHFAKWEIHSNLRYVEVGVQHGVLATIDN